MNSRERIKIYILYKFVEGPWGGGNQFLKALKEYFKKEGVYSESAEGAEVILFNSHHNFDEVFKIKKRYPDKILIHRVGPIFRLARGDKALDKFIFQFNKLFADGTIFQSNWSRRKYYELGIRKVNYETVIINAPDSNIFSPKRDNPPDKRKIKLIATSWSGNIRKGFNVYKFLDEHLDFNRYKMTFVGNSPIEFRNIKWIKPVPSREVAKILKEHDIYIIASENDACSNALIEALHCDLPAVAINSGGNPEIVDDAGILFEDERDIINAIEKVAQNYDCYKTRINLPTFDVVGQKYYAFAQTIYKDYLNGSYNPKSISLLNIMKSRRICMWIIKQKALNKLQLLWRIVGDIYSKSLHRRLLEQEIKSIKLAGLTLDIGSKNRRYDSYFPDVKIVAIDIEPQLKDGSIIKCDARNLSFKDNLLDNIISFETFEYIYETEEVLKEIKRVLKPGGICHFSVPFLNPVHGGMGDIVRYTKRGWEELLQRYFDKNKIEIKSFGGRYSVIFDFWFDKIRKSNIFIKLLFLLPTLIIKRISLLLDKKGRSERYIMGYFIRVEK